ncbi:MAG: hypothetical protein ACHQK8_02615 [Bacteroidia bacterium]
MRIFFTLIFLIVFKFSFSQDLKGTTSVGSDFNFHLYNGNKVNPPYSSSTNYNYIGIGISGLHFITNHTALGIQLSESFTNSPVFSQMNSIYGIAFFSKQYYELNKKMGVVCNESLSFSYGENDNQVSEPLTSKYYFNTNANCTVGLYYFVTKNIATEISTTIFVTGYVKQWNDNNLKPTAQFYSNETYYLNFFIPNPIPFYNNTSWSSLTFSAFYFFNNK